MMHRAGRTVLLILVLTIGLWGCSKRGISTETKMRHLESRNQKLEEDYRTTVADCVRLRKKLADATAECDRMRGELEGAQATAAERDTLRDQVNVCLAQRDEMQSQLVRFRQDLHSLVGRIDQATSANPSGRTLATTVSMTAEK